MVNHSLRFGRLLFLPVVDDAAYMNDGLERLQLFYTSGFSGLIRGFFESAPPHSPFSSGLAMVSFALLGVHDWAPYVGNVIVVFVLVAFVALLMRDAKWWETALACVFALTTPLAAIAVSEFRPDVACGVVTAAGLVLLLGRPFVRSSLRYRLVIGACLGSALVIKPATSPLTLALFGTALSMAFLCDLTSKEHRPSLRELVVAAAPVVVVGFLLAIPYFGVASLTVARYIQRHMLGPLSALWQFRGSKSAHARYLLDGPGGAFMLGSHLWVLLALAVLGALLSLRRRTVTVMRIVSFGVVLVIAYLIPTLSWAKNQFIGIAFQVLLLFSAVLACRLMVTRPEVRPQNSGRGAEVLGRAALVVVVLLGLWLAKFPSALGVRGSEAVESRNRLVRSVYATLKERAGYRKSSTFVTTFGTVNSETLRFLALQEGAALTFLDQALVDDLPAYVGDLERADFAVASEPGSGEVPAWLPSSKVEGQTLALIQSNPDFVQIASLPTLTGKRYYIFERLPKFSGWTALTGMGEVEGPYPQWNLPKVRWGLGPATLLAVDAAQAGRMRLVMSCYAHVPNQAISVRLDGRRIALHALPVAGKAYRFETLLDLSRGPHKIELVYKDSVRDPSSRLLAALFTELRLER